MNLGRSYLIAESRELGSHAHFAHHDALQRFIAKTPAEHVGRPHLRESLIPAGETPIKKPPAISIRNACPSCAGKRRLFARQSSDDVLLALFEATSRWLTPMTRNKGAAAAFCLQLMTMCEASNQC